MAKLVDAPDLGSGAARRGGSSPSTRTKIEISHLYSKFWSIILILIQLLFTAIFKRSAPARGRNRHHLANGSAEVLP